MLKDYDTMACLAAKDFDRAKKFYENLGFAGKDETDGGVIFKSGKTEFLVYPSQFAGTNQATAMGWKVDDVEAEVTELKDKGVVFEEYDFPGLKTENSIATTGNERAAWFKDSEGNIIAVSQALQQ